MSSGRPPVFLPLGPAPIIRRPKVGSMTRPVSSLRHSVLIPSSSTNTTSSLNIGQIDEAEEDSGYPPRSR
jgi:hypothetical protein